MTNNLDKKKYIELLKKADTLENQGKFLLDENRADYRELISYGIVLRS